MTFKTLTILAISSLFAASLAYADPSTDISDTDMSFADNTSMSSGSSGNNIGAMQGDNTNSMGSPTSGNTAGGKSNDSSDDMSADTATGDDDY